jgi:hypothetical protein
MIMIVVEATAKKYAGHRIQRRLSPATAITGFDDLRGNGSGVFS